MREHRKQTCMIMYCCLRGEGRRGREESSRHLRYLDLEGTRQIGPTPPNNLGRLDVTGVATELRIYVHDTHSLSSKVGGSHPWAVIHPRSHDYIFLHRHLGNSHNWEALFVFLRPYKYSEIGKFSKVRAMDDTSHLPRILCLHGRLPHLSSSTKPTNLAIRMLTSLSR